MLEEDEQSSGLASAVMTQLQSLSDKALLVVFHREDYDSVLSGYIVDFNSQFILIQLIDDSFEFAGYSVVLIEDITLLQWGTEFLNKVEKLLKSPRNEFPEAPSLFLESWTTILNTLGEADIAVALYREAVSEAMMISDNFQILDELVIVETINAEGSREGQSMMVADSISQVEFLDNYSMNIAKLAKL